ncbi:hypothetical protein ACH47B_37965 [Rhodococcus sp. NPDC019627]|uniref:hypothetical protein n=1 Tax=unclassified Rhodococcus (in: high G+C Gram-positive bacteria) TaxID=192944 RepID=UPI003406D48B
MPVSESSARYELPIAIKRNDSATSMHYAEDLHERLIDRFSTKPSVICMALARILGAWQVLGIRSLCWLGTSSTSEAGAIPPGRKRAVMSALTR